MPDGRPPVRVLRLITRLNIGGPSIHAVALTDRLTARGFATRLIHGRLGAGEGDMRYLLPPGVDARELASLGRSVAPLQDARALAAVRAIIRDVQPDIVHTHMAKAGLVGRVAAALHNRAHGRAAGARRIKVVHTYHGHVLEGYFNPATTRLFLGVERALARVTDRLVAISPRIRDELAGDLRIGRPDQYRVVPLGFDLAELATIDDSRRTEARRALALPADAHVVVTVGRLTAIKQHTLFLETARLVAERDRAAVFVIVGDGELRPELEAAVRGSAIADRVRFLGWRRDLPTIYGASDVFLLTSRNEGTPVALIEAMAAGTPGVSTDVGGVRDVIDSDQIGRLAPFGDASALADAVVALLGDRDGRRRIGERGRQSVVARYQIDRLVGDIDALYRELRS
jgi:glycosyltransferase involved in cell wall biosynthesis